MTISAGVFVGVTVLFCFVAVLALLGITHIYLSGSDPIERDGLPRGARAPAWTLPDTLGNPHHSPPDKLLQLVVFGDHSLKSFPSVVDGLQELGRLAPELEIVVLLRNPNKLAESMLRFLGLADLPVVTGSELLYGRYNVRVIPFLMFVDSAGLVRGSGLINHAWQVTTLYRIANVPVTPVRQSYLGFQVRNGSRAGV